MLAETQCCTSKLISSRNWQHGQHCLQCRDLGASRPDTNCGKVEMSFAPNLRAEQQMVIRRPDRAVELGARTDQPGPATLPLGPRPEGNQLTSSLNHKGSREDRVSREVLRIHPMLGTEIDLPRDGGALKLGDAGDLPHLAHGKESGLEVDQGTAHVSGGASMRHVGLLEGAHEVWHQIRGMEATALGDRRIALFRASLRPNGSRISCGLRRPQTRQTPSLSSGRRGPAASCAG